MMNDKKTISITESEFEQFVTEIAIRDTQQSRELFIQDEMNKALLRVTEELLNLVDEIHKCSLPYMSSDAKSASDKVFSRIVAFRNRFDMQK